LLEVISLYNSRMGSQLSSKGGFDWHRLAEPPDHPCVPSNASRPVSRHPPSSTPVLCPKISPPNHSQHDPYTLRPTRKMFAQTDHYCRKNAFVLASGKSGLPLIGGATHRARWEGPCHCYLEMYPLTLPGFISGHFPRPQTALNGG